MYLYGAAGPDRWDCSGLTMVAWGNQGVYLPRSAKSQYSYVAKATYPELRAGDLIFWGTNGNPGSVYHVAMYVRDNIIVEATKTGYPVKTRDYRNWAAGDRMAYVGQP
jgi:cell wall-associated NlpC family hydrolase